MTDTKDPVQGRGMMGSPSRPREERDHLGKELYEPDIRGLV